MIKINIEIIEVEVIDNKILKEDLKNNSNSIKNIKEKIIVIRKIINKR